MKNTIFGRSDISARAKGIYAFLIDYEYSVSKNELSDYFKEGRDSINTAFKELVENDYVVIVNIRDDKGKYIGSEIRLLQEDEKI